MLRRELGREAGGHRHPGSIPGDDGGTFSAHDLQLGQAQRSQLPRKNDQRPTSRPIFAGPFTERGSTEGVADEMAPMAGVMTASFPAP